MGKKFWANSRRAPQEVEEEEEDAKKKGGLKLPAWIRDNMPDTLGCTAATAVVLMILCLGLLIYVNSQGDIEPFLKNPAEVVNLNREQDTPRPGRVDKEDLSDPAYAVDTVHRAVQQGNLAAARMLLGQLETHGVLTQADVDALKQMISDAEAQNPIADLHKCRPQDLLSWIAIKGDSKSEPASIMLVDIPGDDNEMDGRGRGVAAIEEIQEGTPLIEVPSHLWLSTAYGAAHELKSVFSENASLLRDFNGLIVTLLYESHRAGGKFWEYMCSLPLHVPLPFLWVDDELPSDFAQDAELVEGRRMWRKVVDLSYNITVPALLSNHSDILKPEMLIPEKWAWACSIIMSRAFAVQTSSGIFSTKYSIANATAAKNPQRLLDQLAGTSKDDGLRLVLFPGIDMLNHGSEGETTANLEIRDNTAVVRARKGLAHGVELTISYGTELCGVRPLNAYGFVWVSCDEEGKQTSADENAEKASGDAKEKEKSEL